jgi:hemerythrin
MSPGGAQRQDGLTDELTDWLTEHHLKSDSDYDCSPYLGWG